MSTSSEEKKHVRKKRVGTVTSAKSNKTIVVEVSRRVPHELYKKVVTKSKRFHVHDENNEANVGDVVEIEETRPISKLKRWKLLNIVRRNEKEQV